MSKIARVLLLLLNSFPFNPSVFTKDPFLPAYFCKSLLNGQKKKAIIGQVSLFQRKTVWRHICETPHIYSLLSWGAGPGAESHCWAQLTPTPTLTPTPICIPTPLCTPTPIHTPTQNTNYRAPFRRTKSSFFTMEIAFYFPVTPVTHSLV